MQIVELLIQKTPLVAAFTMQELKVNDELLADFGDAAADTVRSAAKSQVITNNLNEEVNTWKERYDGWCPQPNRDLEAGSGPSQECLGQGGDYMEHVAKIVFSARIPARSPDGTPQC